MTDETEGTIEIIDALTAPFMMAPNGDELDRWIEYCEVTPLAERKPVLEWLEDHRRQKKEMSA